VLLPYTMPEGTHTMCSQLHRMTTSRALDCGWYNTRLVRSSRHSVSENVLLCQFSEPSLQSRVLLPQVSKTSLYDEHWAAKQERGGWQTQAPFLCMPFTLGTVSHLTPLYPFFLPSLHPFVPLLHSF